MGSWQTALVRTQSRTRHPGMGLVRIHPAAHTEKSRTVHGGCCITETSAVKGMVFAANSHGICHVPGRFAWLCSVLGRVEGSVTIHLPQTPPHTHQGHAPCPGRTAEPSGGTCWQSARSGSACRRVATSERRLGCKRCTLVSRARERLISPG